MTIHPMISALRRHKAGVVVIPAQAGIQWRHGLGERDRHW